ncbi:microsomal signal peptidase 25 kDa subunit [Actinidia rufa]|uniref:Signal peptidase complex subunit 2 n=1 Tax=Actinidia rufa TaxID=165716 RepID=A0A7J0DDB8_9ERIC|nr:microsomal signal peptidase 25 kDa subunit [Actinidia rufa]
MYTLTVASADPKSISAKPPVEFTKSVTKWFAKDGVLVEGLFWKDVDGLVNALVLIASSKLPRFSDMYTLTVASADPKSISAKPHVEFTKSVTKWFTKDGVLVEGLFWKDVDGLVNDYAKESKRACESVVVKVWESNQQSLLLCLLGTGPRKLEGRPAQTNRKGVMGRVHGSRRDPRKDEYGKISRRWRRHNWGDCHLEGFWRVLVEIPSILHRPRARRRQYPGSFGELMSTPMVALASSVEMTWRGSMNSFYLGQGIRLPNEGETITSTRPGEVAFYEAAFPAGLRFPLYNTIRLILQFYNICSAQLVPNSWRSIAYSMALWLVLYFKARNKKVLLEGYPSNVKGWKSKFFFVSGDEWEIPEGVSRKGAPRVPRTWGIPDKTCNNPPQFYGDETRIFEEIFRASRTAGYNLPSGEVPSSSSDVELRRLLPHIPDLTLLRWMGGKVLDPILDHYLNVPSSNPSSESYSDSSLPVELESDAMSKRVSFKKIDEIDEKLGKATSASSGAPVPAKRVIIGEKRPGDSITSSPSKKGKVDDGSKGKGVVIGPEGKKKATSSGKAPTPPATASPRPGEGSSANLGTVLGPTASMLGSPSVAEKLLRGVIPPADKEKVEKLTLDQTATKLFHVIGQALVLGSSLAVQSREASEQASLQEGRAASMETEIARLQKVAADLEQQLAESRAREQQANDKLTKGKSDRDSLSDKFERSGVLVNELREALNKSKEFVVEEFKSSSEFMVAVEDSASKYFGEGF